MRLKIDTLYKVLEYEGKGEVFKHTLVAEAWCYVTKEQWQKALLGGAQIKMTVATVEILDDAAYLSNEELRCSIDVHGIKKNKITLQNMRFFDVTELGPIENYPEHFL